MEAWMIHLVMDNYACEGKNTTEPVYKWIGVLFSELALSLSQDLIRLLQLRA